ncbi:MAG: hypothetical protein OSJ65_04670 [Bacilli bacterium]|nr:hypothetical protein [Bacilli bacterium]
MVKKEITKEEKKAIKQYKNEEKGMKLEKERKSLRKEHLYLVLAILVLLSLVAILVYMIFSGKEKALIVPDLPTHESLDVGIVDFSDSSSTANDLNSKKNSNLSVSYNLVTDYYKEGILLSNTQADYMNDSIIVTSGPLSENPFISSLTEEGTLKWLTKLDDKEYERINVYKTIFINKNYYLFGICKKDKESSLIAIKLDEFGKKKTTRILKNNIDSKIKDVISIENRIAIVLGDSAELTVILTDEELNTNKNEIPLSKYIDNSSYLNYQTGTNKNGGLNLVVNNSNTFYTVDIDTNSLSASVKEMTELNNLKTDETIRVTNYLEGYMAYTNTNIYKFNPENKLINKFDYSKIKLENDEEFKEKYKDDEFFSSDDLENTIYVDGINYSSSSLVVNTKTLFSSIYDVYDSSLKISKRIILDKFKYSYPEGMLLNSFYINGSIYEVYSYGSETPSIMISKIG